jgi:hypothetical protein
MRCSIDRSRLHRLSRGRARLKHILTGDFVLERQAVTDDLPVDGRGPVGGDAGFIGEPWQALELARADPGRQPLEAFVRSRFRRVHGATVRSFMPTLIGLYGTAGKIAGVAGYRPADLEPLYLEQYLTDPIENVIAGRYPGLQVDRAQVAEIGNFACRDCESAMAMVQVLARLLRERHRHWVAFTATRAVRNITRRLGMQLREIGRADAARLLMPADDWGSYYDADPRVMLGYVPAYRGRTGQSRGG